MSRHANAGRKLSRNSSHRKALLDNLVRAMILNESIRTTTPKAKETRRLVERVITKARENSLSARRVVHKTVRDQAALAKLVQSIGPRFKARPDAQAGAGDRRFPAEAPSGLRRDVLAPRPAAETGRPVHLLLRQPRTGQRLRLHRAG